MLQLKLFYAFCFLLHVLAPQHTAEGSLVKQAIKVN